MLPYAADAARLSHMGGTSDVSAMPSRRTTGQRLMQQVICMRCGAQFRVAGAGPVYCPNCGVLLGPAPATGAASAQAVPGPNAGPAAFPPSGTPIRMASPASPAASPVPGAAPPTTPLPPGMGPSGVAPPGYAPPSVPLGGTYGM